MTPPRDAGISLIEVVVAVLILSIGVVAGFQTLGQSRHAIGGEMPRWLAQTVALNMAAQARIGGAATLPASVEMGGIVWTVDMEVATTQAGFTELSIRILADGHPGAMLTTYASQGPPP